MSDNTVPEPLFKCHEAAAIVERCNAYLETIEARAAEIGDPSALRYQLEIAARRKAEAVAVYRARLSELHDALCSALNALPDDHPLMATLLAEDDDQDIDIDHLLA